MKNFDNSFLNDNIKLIAGTDEAGRGPLAGPVVAASVIFSPDVYIEGVNDSKQLSVKKREILFEEIIKHSIAWGVSVVSHGKIDEINILNASLLAMLNSVKKLKIKPGLILIDGNKAFHYDVQLQTVVKGDSKSFCIAAASILAKVARDTIMIRLSHHFPEYNWEQNKGYPTKHHIETIKLIGASPLHRKTFLRNILTDKSEAGLKLQTVY
ncbi:MAG: ribonuclease HII [Bacteroidetes bacterium]|nr:ribonuclease HII [Bacteroidota bacterium]